MQSPERREALPIPEDPLRADRRARRRETLRLGKDWWATLDATLPLTLGQTKVASGIYYLGLHKTDKGQWQLMLLDPKEVRKKKAHPGLTPALTAALNVDLNYRKFDKSADKLTINIKPLKSDPSVGSLVIHWGNHLLQAPVKAHFGAKKAAEAAGKKADKKADKKDGKKADKKDGKKADKKQ